jgi:DNA-binding CsgD family transcriptional regulator
VEERLSLDPIALIERGYQHYPDDSSWLQGAIEDVVQELDPTCLAALSYVHGIHGPEEPIVVRPSAGVSTEQAKRLVATGFATSTPEEHRMIATACRKPGLSSLRQILGDTSMDSWLARRPERPSPFADAVAVMLPGPEGKPLVVTVTCARPRRIHDAEQALWHRIAIHWSAGWRLAGRAPDADAADVEAILTSEGKVAHASGPGATKQGHELLRQATRDIDRARSRKGRSDPLEALALWQGLLAGRWSLVERFDTDGRRFMLACRNEPGLPASASLTRRQRQVVFYASLGLSNKEIAYALGLAENTISAHLSGGLARLRIKSRAELIRTSSELATAALAALAPQAARPAAS